VSIEQIEDISIYDVDQVLRSPAFGLISTYSPETQEKIEEYQQLSFKFPDFDPDEKKLYEKLREFMQKAQPYSLAEPNGLNERINRFLDEKLP
jgi:hypothetical protein